MNLLENAVVETQPGTVIYRVHRQTGNLVVRVFTSSDPYRISFHVECLHDIYPTTLFLDEITAFVEDAKRRTEQ